MESRDEDACESLSPSLVPERLRSAMDKVADADRCLDLTAAAWRPVASDRWEQARRLLAEVRSELEAALLPWSR
jgi:hypothetical protein